MRTVKKRFSLLHKVVLHYKIFPFATRDRLPAISLQSQPSSYLETFFATDRELGPCCE
jgi:hypothetical protein